MKHKINKLGLLFISIFIISSCTENEEIESYDTGAEPILKTTSISVFDVNHTIDIEYFLAEGVTINSASYNDAKVTDISITVTGNKASFNTSIKDSLARTFNIVTMLSNGITTTKPMAISVGSSVVVSEDGILIEEGVDVAKVDEDGNLVKDAAFVFTNKVSSATIYKTTTHWKKGENGTFAPAMDLSLSLATPGSKDSINLRTLDYTAAPYNLIKRDTLFLMAISESGVLKDTVSTKLIFSPQFFVDYTTSETLVNNSGVNLLNGDEIDPDLFLNTAGSSLLIENSKFMYVDISSETAAYKKDLLEIEDYVAVMDKYNAGTETSNALLTTNLKKGNLYIYSVERVLKVEDKADKVVTHYGLLSIDSVTETNVDGDVKTSIEISSKEGEGE
jgi:hypothetical protein